MEGKGKGKERERKGKGKEKERKGKGRGKGKESDGREKGEIKKKGSWKYKRSKKAREIKLLKIENARLIQQSAMNGKFHKILG